MCAVVRGEWDEFSSLSSLWKLEHSPNATFIEIYCVYHIIRGIGHATFHLASLAKAMCILTAVAIICFYRKRECCGNQITFILCTLWICVLHSLKSHPHVGIWLYRNQKTSWQMLRAAVHLNRLPAVLLLLLQQRWCKDMQELLDTFWLIYSIKMTEVDIQFNGRQICNYNDLQSI